MAFNLWWPAKGPPKFLKALTGTPPVLDGIRDGWTTWPLLGGGSRQRIQEAFNTAQSANYGWMYRNSPALRTVVDVLVRNIGQLDLRLYEEIDESQREPRPDHPAALSLRYPSETVTADQFIREMVLDYLLYSNAYAVMIPAAGRQLSFFRVPVPLVEVLGSSLFVAEGYRVRGRNGVPNDYTPDQVLHWRGTNPDDPRVGLSRLETLRGVVAEDAALQAAITELANSGMTEPYAFVRPLEAPEWSNTARQGFEEDLNNRLRRRNRMPVVLEEGITPVKLGTSPRDAQMLDVRRWATERFCGVFGVPLGMVGLDDNLKEAQSVFYADTLPPYCEEFTKMLNQRILVRAYGWTAGCFEFNLDEKHMGDDRIKSLVSATGRAVMVTNEARAKLNLPPIDDGDELVTPLNVIVGKNPKPSTDIMGPQDPNKPSQDGSYREEPKALTNGRKQLEPAAADREFEPVPQLHPGRKADLDRQHRNIDLAQAVIERHFGRLERSLRNAKARTDWSRWDREFADDLHRYVEQVVEKEGSIYSFKLGGGGFDMQQVTNYLKAMAEGAAEGINAKIREEIDDLGLDEALGRRAQHVESAGAGLGAGATRWAREEAARQAPGTEERVKTWIPNTKRHAQYGGQSVPLGADWPAGFAPGTAPGCKCSQAID